MRTPQHFRTVLTAAALGGALVLAGCSGGDTGSEATAGGGDQSQQSGSQQGEPGGAGPEGGGGAVTLTNEQIAAALEAVDVDGTSLQVTERLAGGEGVVSFEPESIEPAGCAALFEDLPGVQGVADSGVSGSSTDAGLTLAGAALDDAEAAQDIVATQVEVPSACSEMALDIGVGEPVEGTITEHETPVEGAISYQLDIGAGGITTTIYITNLAVGNALVLGVAVPQANDAAEQELADALTQVRDELESQAG